MGDEKLMGDEEEMADGEEVGDREDMERGQRWAKEFNTTQVLELNMIFIFYLNAFIRTYFTYFIYNIMNTHTLLM